MKNNKNKLQFENYSELEFIPVPDSPEKGYKFGDTIQKPPYKFGPSYRSDFLLNGYIKQMNGKYVAIEYPPPLIFEGDPNKDEFLAKHLREAINDIAILDGSEDKEGTLKKVGWDKRHAFAIYSEGYDLGKFFTGKYFNTKVHEDSDLATIKGLESLLFSSDIGWINLWIKRKTQTTDFNFLKESYGVNLSEKLQIEYYEHGFVGDRMKSYISLMKMYKEKGDDERINHALNRVKKEFHSFVSGWANSNSVKIGTKKEWFGDGLMSGCGLMSVKYRIYSDECLKSVKKVMKIINTGLNEMGYGAVATSYSPEDAKIVLENNRKVRKPELNPMNNFF